MKNHSTKLHKMPRTPDIIADGILYWFYLHFHIFLYVLYRNNYFNTQVPESFGLTFKGQRVSHFQGTSNSISILCNFFRRQSKNKHYSIYFLKLEKPGRQNMTGSAGK